ncbi:hypothetical protein CRM22_006108 [Opisthorchis felineus]|uniref:Caspase family p20 domain-containing protein n=1 Tax=Opisthorchis felineus TaxID=147828 RepID=A0A4S2LMP5_OPIFE|nr:hypothetical protein CRM22_006108 [Opisthorchis felineus]
MSTDAIDSKLQDTSEVCPQQVNPVFRLSPTEISDPTLHYPIRECILSKQIYRGLCLIINQKDFSPETGQTCREGTDRDADRVERLFKMLGYNVQRYLNVNRNKLHRLLRDAATYDHSQFDSFVCVILSHGENGVIYATDGPVPIDVVIANFRGDQCTTLSGKPKLFFIQACRGVQFDKGAAIPLATDAVGEVVITKLPVEADILIAHSTVPGYFAWRNSTVGSWFIQELCRILEEDFKGSTVHDLVTLLTVVARCVAYQYRSNTGQAGSHNMLQMTNYSSTLTRLMYLTVKPKDR